MAEHRVADYQTIRLSLKGHPLKSLREMFMREGIVTCKSVAETRGNDRRARLVLLAGVIQARPEGVVHLVAQRLIDSEMARLSDNLSAAPPLPAGAALIEPLHDDRCDHPDAQAQRTRHPRDVQILPPSRYFH